MQTLSAEQFKKLYGEDTYNQFSPPKSALGRPSIGETIANSFKAGVNQVKEGVKQVGDTSGNPLNLIEGIGKVGAGAIGAAFSPIAPVVEPTIGKATNFVADKISNIPAVQDFASTKAGDVTSRVAGDVANYANIAGTVGGALEVPKVSTAIKTGVTDAVGEGLSNVKSAFDSVAENVSKYPKQIADKITLGKIDQKVQTILKESPASTLDKYVEIGQKALKDPRQLTPLEMAGQVGEEVAKTIKKDLNSIGEQKTAALDSVKDTRVPQIAIDQIEKIKPLLQKKLTDSERGIVNEYLVELKSLGKNPTAGSIDATIDKLQSTIYEKSKGVAIPMTTRVKSFINQSIGELNGKLKTAVDTALGNDSYSALNGQYADKIRVFQTLNKALGEGGTKGGSLMKRFFSPQDGGIKDLFATIKKDYGVDLGANATLAKFVMDTLGDTRAKSLLQLPPTTPLGLAAKGLDFIENKLKSPERTIKKARELTIPSGK